MNDRHRTCVVMAGGSGERFWPLSRQSRPKQLLRLTHPDRNLLEETVFRVQPLFSAGEIYVATSRALQPLVRNECEGVPANNVLAEPSKRNTAGCLAYVTAHLLAQFGTEALSHTLAVLSADHRIGNVPGFLDTLRSAIEAVEQRPCLAVIGVRPDRAETGYGYIEIPADAAAVAVENAPCPVYPVASFREKPDAETAAGFLTAGRFLWNTGMFFWNVAHFMEELAQASPVHAQAIYAMAEAMKDNDSEAVDRTFDLLENISIDYVLMEKARDVVVVPATFEWDDLGAWDALDRAHDHDEQGNVTIGDPVLVNAVDCIVYNEAGPERMAVAVVGVEGLAVVVREDGVLVIPKDRVQEVRKAVEILKQRNATQL